MKRARFTEQQVIGVLKEQEAGAKTADLARRHGVSEATIYNWKAKYGGLEVSEAKRLRLLEDENAKLKRLLAEAMLDNAGLRIFRKKLVTPSAKRAAGVPCYQRWPEEHALPVTARR
jgi:putative transposase